MYWLDFVLLLVLGIGAFLGARSGLLWQVARIVTFVLAVYACIRYHGVVAGWLLQIIRADSPVVPWLLAYLVTFLAVYAVCMVLTYVLERMLHAAKLKPMDRLLGAGVGILKAGLLAGAILMGVALYDPDADGALGESKVAPVLLKSMRVVIVAVPDEYKNRFEKAKERIFNPPDSAGE
ncbi:MAG: CvpA family protein [Planctomycetes bacterium]|nr:CvpA family protein [Planctomycetota bacterium]